MGKIATIESGQEPPEPAIVQSYGVEVSLKDTIRLLEVGQSFVVDGHSARVRALQVGVQLSIHLTSRKIGKTKRYRIWRRANSK